MSNLSTDVLQHDAEEIQSILTERVKTAREEIILAHHEIGKIIHTRTQEGHKVTALMQYYNEHTKVGERTLWDSYDFFQHFPNYNDIDKLGHGANISFNKIKSHIKALKGGVEEKVEKEYCTCHCGNKHPIK